MARIAAQVPGEVERVVRKVALAVDQTAVLATPVDTGRARSNWVVSVGSPEEGERVLESFDRSGGAALDQGRDAARRYRAGGVIWIVNNVPYIERLENGWSAQAPSGMLSAAIQAGLAVAKGEKVRVR